MTYRLLLLFLTLFALGCKSVREDSPYHYTPDESILYKDIDSVKLSIEVFYPDTKDPLNPAILFYFGGGWQIGSTAQFAPHADHFRRKGYVTILVDYRVKSRHGTSPFESLMDAKSAIRYVKEHAEILRVDSSKIILCGASAGGQLAAACALTSLYNDSQDNLSIHTNPKALVLFNPVIDNGPEGYGYDVIGSHYKTFSPLHNVTSGAPPTLILTGTKDRYLPVKTIEYYKHRMDSVGSDCKIIYYNGQDHGFFNYRFQVYYQKTIKEMEQFLQPIVE